jgi:serine/threonine-protein kinase
VTGANQAKILDFGLAKMLAPERRRERDAAATDDPSPRSACPTARWATARPSRPRRSADHRTDVFSLGVLLYEMVTGSAPFRGRHAVEVLNAVINETPRPIASCNPRAPAGCSDPRPRDGQGPARPLPDDGRLRDELKALDAPAHARDRRADRATATRRAAAARAAWSLTGSLGRVLGGSRPAAGREPRSGPQRACRARRPASWATGDKPTLAVLPFKNLAATRRRFYEFSLADGVITELAHLKSLVVRPSAYIAQYVGQPSTRARSGETGGDAGARPALLKAQERIARHRPAARRPRAARSCGATRSTSPRRLPRRAGRAGRAPDRRPASCG